MRWNTVKLNDLATNISYGLSLSAESSVTEHKFLRITDIQDGRVDWEKVPYCTPKTKRDIKKCRLNENDVVFARTGATTGKSHLISSCPSGALFASYLIRVTLKKNVDPKYIYYYFQTPSYWDQITTSSVGSTTAGVNSSKLKDLDTPLPPFETQKRIAELLDRAQALIEKRKEQITLMDKLIQSLFSDMFGDPVRNSRGWDLLRFEQVCSSRLGKMLDKKKESGEHQKQYLRNANVKWFYFELNEVYSMDFLSRELQKFKLKYGDILICEGGEPGRAAIWKDKVSECYYQKALHRARIIGDKARGEYIVYLFWFFSKNGGFKDHISSATIAHLTGEKLKKMAIPVPPIILQEAFADHVRKIEAQKEVMTTSLHELEDNFGSIMQRAFKGEI